MREREKGRDRGNKYRDVLERRQKETAADVARLIEKDR